jgi:uncharacterized protein
MEAQSRKPAVGALAGVRVWLSGSIPPSSDEGGAQRIRNFVRFLAGFVFKAGGHIIHGSDPSFTPILLEQAQRHVSEGGRKDCVTLVVSRKWSKNSKEIPIQKWREVCTVYETPESSSTNNAREESLEVLRQWMADRSDAFVAVGGNWWEHVPDRAGLPIEASMAVQRGLPCFLLGGLGGAAADFLERNPEVIRSLRNGLSVDRNRELAFMEDAADVAREITLQLGRLPLVRGRVSDGISFRILALDGGGLKGAFTAAVLARLEQSTGQRIAKHFDLIAGTSTGGILAIALGLGLRPSDMLAFYRERGPVVFPIMRLRQNLLAKMRAIARPRYSQTVLRAELEQAYFPDGSHKSLRESACRLVIPAYNAVSGISHVFRTPHHGLLTADEDADMAEVALATAAAPTYFPSAMVKNLVSKASFFDGGVWANCPAMAAIVEAVCYLGVPLDRIDVLSVGTTEEPFTLKSMATAGLGKWSTSIINLLMNAQMESSIKHAQLLVGQPRFLRLNVMTSPGEYKLDGANEIENLITLGDTKASDADVMYQVKSRFLNGIEVLNWK